MCIIIEFKFKLPSMEKDLFIKIMNTAISSLSVDVHVLHKFALNVRGKASRYFC